MIVPDITFVASANAVRYCGGTPVLADIRSSRDASLDPAELERLLTERTRAVCLVHYGGYAAPVAELAALCETHGLALIEDAAHAPDASARDSERKLGTWGLAGAFSFFSNKVIGCGEGGLIATDHDEVAESTRSLRSHAMTSGTWDRHTGHSLGYDVVGLGFNYRIDEPRAALLSARLPGLAADVARRRELTMRYHDALADVDWVEPAYTRGEVATSSCYVMPVVLERVGLQAPLRERMRERHGVQTSVLYPAIHEFTAYEGVARPGSLGRAELWARTQVALPLHPHLSEHDQDRVIAALAQSLDEMRRSASATPAAGTP